MKEYRATVDKWNTAHWYKPNSDIRHREGGPAIEYVDGSKEWFINRKRHREDGPAVEFVNGYKAWYINGKRHREDGPAIELADGSKWWFINGKCLPEEEFNNRHKTELTMDEIAAKFDIDVKNLKIKK